MIVAMFDHFFHQHLLQHVEYVKADGIIFLLGGGLNQLIRQLRDFVEGTNCQADSAIERRMTRVI
jgi:hypothetical protein